MKKALFVLICLAGVSSAQAQQYLTRYFEFDTSAYTVPLRIHPQPSTVWQIGKPQKKLFDQAASQPNALVTDTLKPYPVNDSSTCTFSIVDLLHHIPPTRGILVCRWKQKLDFDPGKDGGIVEYSSDGVTWSNAFNWSPVRTEFYGYNQANEYSLPDGQLAFSGRDTTWRDIWLCFNLDQFLTRPDSVLIRFTLKSDSVDQHNEGWMIDNVMTGFTVFHPVKQFSMKDIIDVYPIPTTGVLNMEVKTEGEHKIIKSVEVMDMDGRLLETNQPNLSKSIMDLSAHPSGMYYIRVTTNKETKTVPVILRKNH